MLKFLVYDGGKPAEGWTLRNGHLLGPDDIGLRANIRLENGQILCTKNTMGPAALALQFDLEGAGDLMLQTCLLRDREKPYLLTLEMARHRLMKLIAKQEDWGLLNGEEPVAHQRVRLAKQRFVEALNVVDDPARADELSRQSLVAAITASEEMALAYAEEQLAKRRKLGQLSRHTFGCGVRLAQSDRVEGLSPTILSHFDYLRAATPWKVLVPAEQQCCWKPLDAWCTMAFLNQMPVVAGPIISFEPNEVPDWLYVWQHDYDTVRDLVYEHVEGLVARYRSVVSLWNVVSGIHVNAHFRFNLEQVMDLTRMAVTLTKKVHPGCKVLIEVTHPFGEYHAYNPQSIPPLMYAEMVLQSGIPFDGFGLKLLMGRPSPDHATRDLLQVSVLLDRFGTLGKPLHITAAGVPSEPCPPPESSGQDNGEGPTGGFWRKPWSPMMQGHWLEAFYNVMFSKPMVESVAWMDLADGPGEELPGGGLVAATGEPKHALERLIALRKSFRGET